MRVILYTGKGGVGKTSIAAATACKIASEGKKVLIMSTDQAHSLGDSFENKLSSEIKEIKKNLFALELDVVMENERLWKKTRKYIEKVLLFKTQKTIDNEELLVFPGFEELVALLKIREFSESSDFDVLIIDCAPTGESMALLKFPELFKWWIDKILPAKKKAAMIAKPIVDATIKFPLPEKEIFTEFEALYEQLEELHKILIDKERTSIRIVTTPEKIVINESMRSFTNFHLFDFNVDSIIINRIFSEKGAKGYFEKWLKMQSENIEKIYKDFSPIPIFRANLLDNELKGYNDLYKMGSLIYKDEHPSEVLFNKKIFIIDKIKDNFVLKIDMPFVDKKKLSIYQSGNEITIAVNNEKRNFLLPKKLKNKNVEKAFYEDGYLNIQFD
jgi:arsenite-transporting ATPase